MEYKKLNRIRTVIKPRDADQFVRNSYFYINGDISENDYNGYIERIKEQIFENWYTQEDLETIKTYWRELAENMDWITIDFS